MAKENQHDDLYKIMVEETLGDEVKKTFLVLKSRKLNGIGVLRFASKEGSLDFPINWPLFEIVSSGSVEINSKNNREGLFSLLKKMYPDLTRAELAGSAEGPQLKLYF